MIKAVILTMIGGLLGSRLPWVFAFSAMTVLITAEMTHLVMNRDHHSLLHLAADIAALDLVGQLFWFLGVWFFHPQRRFG